MNVKSVALRRVSKYAREMRNPHQIALIRAASRRGLSLPINSLRRASTANSGVKTKRSETRRDETRRYDTRRAAPRRNEPNCRSVHTSASRQRLVCSFFLQTVRYCTIYGSSAEQTTVQNSALVVGVGIEFVIMRSGRSGRAERL